MSMTQEQINVDLFYRCKQLEAELATLQAKAKAYDEGETQSAIYNGKGVFLWCENGSYGKAEIPATYSERKVRVCKEVES